MSNKEGLQSLDLSPSSIEALTVTDANLPSGVPLKSGETNKIISIACWFKIDIQSVYDGLVSKYDLTGNKRSFILGLGATANNLSFFVGYNSGASSEEKILFSSLVTGRWYHIGIAYNNSGDTVGGLANKAYHAVLWDNTAGDYHAANVTGSSTNDIYISTAALAIGTWMTNGSPYGDYCFDGHLDEILIFNDVLSTTEIDQIRAGTYGAAVGGQPTIKRFGGVPFCKINQGVW
jgi:hypothetical protein